MSDGTSKPIGGKVNELKLKWREFSTKYNVPHRMNILARMMVCVFFFNHIYTKLEIWYYYRQPFPYFHIILLPASFLVGFDVQATIFATVMCLIAAWDGASIMYNQLDIWYRHGHLYINELMVKKLSLLGASGLILAQRYQSNTVQSRMAGLLLSAKEAMSTKKSVLMLVGRLLLSTLFLYVGITEIQRQMEASVDHDGHQHRKRPSGDGHDHIWYKLLEFALSLPFIIGFKTKEVCWMLSTVLVIEALTAWAWWASQLNIGYKIHAREHFCVNVSVAGGLLLLSFVGAGKYTIDELIKKKD